MTPNFRDIGIRTCVDPLCCSQLVVHIACCVSVVARGKKSKINGFLPEMLASAGTQRNEQKVERHQQLQTDRQTDKLTNR